MQKSTEARTQMTIATPFSLPAAPLHRFWSHKHEVRWPALPQVWRWNWCFQYNMDMSTTYIKLWFVYWHCLCSPRRREGNRRCQWWGRSTSGPGHHLKQINDSYLSIYHLYRSLPPWGRTGPGRWSRSRSPLSLGSSLGLRVRRCSIGDRLQQQLHS